MIKQLSPDNMVPKLMYLLRFHGALTIRSIHNYTSFGKASIRNALDAMVKEGLLKKSGARPTIYELTNDSDGWLGWRKDFKGVNN